MFRPRRVEKISCAHRPLWPLQAPDDLDRRNEVASVLVSIVSANARVRRQLETHERDPKAIPVGVRFRSDAELPRLGPRPV